MKLPLLLSATVFLFTPLAGLHAQPSAKASFTEGIGTSNVDGLPGGAGNGWAAPWRTYPFNFEQSFRVELLSEPPLPGVETFLSIRPLPADQVEKRVPFQMWRPVDADVASLKAPFTATWKFRWEAAENEDAERGGVSFVIYPESAGGGPVGSLCYIQLSKQQWQIVKKSDTGGMQYVKLDFSAESGQNLSFKVEVHPDAGTFTVAIESASGERYESQPMDYLAPADSSGAVFFRFDCANLGGIALGDIEITSGTAAQ